MSDLEKLYNESNADNVVKARLQSEGSDSVAVNHFDTTNSYSHGFIPRLLDKNPGERTEFNSGVMDQQYVVELGKVDSRYTEYNRENKYTEKNPNLPGVINKSR